MVTGAVRGCLDISASNATSEESQCQREDGQPHIKEEVHREDKGRWLGVGYVFPFMNEKVQII